ncbi:MAG TPA: PAS domain-containing protein [Dehalococcoidia bacterium]|nr:PAS domain-containing protein [Dehalococcoidia bacterium]
MKNEKGPDRRGPSLQSCTRTSDEASRLRLIEAALGSSAQGIVVVDGQGDPVFMNQAARELLGGRHSPALALRGQAAGLAMRFTDGRLISTEDAPLSRALRGETVTDLRLALGETGGQVYINSTVTPVKDERGAVIGAIALFRDITDRRLAQEERERLLGEVSAQRRLFEMVVDNSPIGICVLRGRDLIVELANPAFRAIAPGKVMPGRTVAEVWPEIASQSLPRLQRVYQTGEPFCGKDMPFRIRRAPEAPLEERFFTFIEILMRGSEDQGDAILIIASETTDEVLARQRVEDLAEAAQHRAVELHAVLENMVEAVFVCDVRGRITHANEAGARLLGLPSVEEVVRTLSEFPAPLRMRHLDGRPLGREEMPLVRALAGETVTQASEIVYNSKLEQDIFIRTSAAPMRDEKGTIIGAVAVARDVTELTELDRLKDKFITVAAHELKTPAAIMKGYAQAFLRSAENVVPETRRLVDAISRGADRIDVIVRDLLDISRLHSSLLDLAVERIDLPVLVQEVVDRMAPSTTKHHIRVVKAEPATVSGDRDRLEQVLTNLIDNAIRYSPKGGYMDVGVGAREGEAVVSVRDYGVGIPEDKQTRIFERFYRAHTGTPYDYGGMGVGLYISREIVLRHGGRMWFESEEDGGTTFYFSLPL